MLNHSVPKHFPKDIAPELRQCGVDEQVLFLQCLRQRTTWSGIFLFYPRIFYEAGDDLQRTDRFI